jgi:hypothetical protein
MKTTKRFVVTALCLLLGATGNLAVGRDDVLTAIPADVLGFAVVHNLSAASHDISELAKLVQAPAPDLLSLAKGITGLQKGIDEEGDLAIVVTEMEPAPKPFILAPVSNFDEFFAALKVENPAEGLQDVQIAGSPSVVGRKGSFAVIAPATERDALEKFLASTTNMASDKPLTEWLDKNRASVVVTSQGTKLAIPKITAGIRQMQAQMMKVGGPNAKTSADAMGLYLDFFDAAEKEVEQASIGLRIDSAQTVDLFGRATLKSGGTWATWAAQAKPPEDDLLGGLEPKPLVMAMGGIVPREAMKVVMNKSMTFMRTQPGFQGLTPEMAAKYSELSMRGFANVKAMRMLMGVPQAESGMYSNTSFIMTVDDSKKFVDTYEQTLSEIRKLAEENKNTDMPLGTSNRIKLGDIDALEVTMTLPQLKQLQQPGAPDPEKIMKLFVGEDGKMKMYLAPADEHNVITTYISPDHLKEAIEFYKSKQPGLSKDPAVAQVLDKMPVGCQVVACMSMSGVMQMSKQMMMLSGAPAPAAAFMPEFPDSPPFGFCGKFSEAGIETHWLITADTLRSIGDGIAKVRAKAREQQLQLQQQ